MIATERTNRQSPSWLKTGAIFGLLIVGLIIVIGLLGRGMKKTEPSTASLRPQNFTLAKVATNETNANLDQWLEGADDDPWLGTAQADIIIMEFSDFSCPFCQASFPVIRELMAKYGNRIKFIYRDWPVAEIHPDATLAAEAGQCAWQQDKFWPFHDRLFINQDDLSKAALIKYAKQSGLDVQPFIDCLDSGVYRSEVKQDIEQGLILGVKGTPTWFINGQKIEGSLPYDAWEQIILNL